MTPHATTIGRPKAAPIGVREVGEFERAQRAPRAAASVRERTHWLDRLGQVERAEAAAADCHRHHSCVPRVAPTLGRRRAEHNRSTVGSANKCFWIVHEIKGKRRAFVQEAGALIFARLNASITGFEGEFAEAHELDAARAKKVPRRMIGRALSDREVRALLERMS